LHLTSRQRHKVEVTIFIQVLSEVRKTSLALKCLLSSLQRKLTNEKQTQRQKTVDESLV
jgi:glucan phosphoethanolaminetransferase (alkaline phosphatase superfamily)